MADWSHAARGRSSASDDRAAASVGVVGHQNITNVMTMNTGMRIGSDHLRM